MSLQFNLNQELTQKLTTELIQNLKVLQFSHVELNDYIYERSTENPLIELTDTDMSTLNNLIEQSSIDAYHSSIPTTQDFFNPIELLHSSREVFKDLLIEQIPLNIGLSSLDYKILRYLILHLNQFHNSIFLRA